MYHVTSLLRREQGSGGSGKEGDEVFFLKELERKGLKLSVTEDGKEGKSKMIASCGFLEEKLRECSKEEGVTIAESVETLGVDLRTRVKRSGAKEKARRRKCRVRFSLIKKNKAFQKSCVKVGVKKLLRAGMVPARTWGVHAVVMAPTERLKLSRQMAAAAGKQSTNSLSLFMEAYGLEVEEELSTLGTQFWAEGVWTGKWHLEQGEAWMKQIQEVQMWRQVRGPAGAVMCVTRDLGIKWPHWNTLIFSDETRIDKRFVCPRDVKKMLVQGPVQSSGRSGQQSTNMKSSRKEHGSNRLKLSCERK